MIEVYGKPDVTFLGYFEDMSNTPYIACICVLRAFKRFAVIVYQALKELFRALSGALKCICKMYSERRSGKWK